MKLILKSLKLFNLNAIRGQNDIVKLIQIYMTSYKITPIITGKIVTYCQTKFG